MSNIITTFVLSVVNTEDGFDKHLGVAEGRLRPTLYFYMGETYEQVGVYSVPIVCNSYRAKLQIIIDISKQLGIKKFPTVKIGKKHLILFELILIFTVN